MTEPTAPALLSGEVTTASVVTSLSTAGDPAPAQVRTPGLCPRCGEPWVAHGGIEEPICHDERAAYGPAQVCCWGGANDYSGCLEPALPGRLGCREHVIAVEARDHEPPVATLVYDRDSRLWQRRPDKWVCVTQGLSGGSPQTCVFAELLTRWGPVKQAVATGRVWGA